MAIFPIRPFWNDEWRLVYNLKTKDIQGLWGQLDLLQQCPRTYLTVYKLVTRFFDYSYTSLRIPALIIGTTSVIVLWSLKGRIIRDHPVYSLLFVLIIVSSQTFTDYLVQTKQYEMDILLCILALWQLLTLLQISNNGLSGRRLQFALLCTGFAVAPFFSYIYPIAVAPIFPIVLIALYYKPATGGNQSSTPTRLLTVLLPLVLVASSIVIFYVIDVRQLMSDNRMYLSYQRMLGLGDHEIPFVTDAWRLFALVGSGLLFEIIFGIIGLLAFGYGIYRIIKTQLTLYRDTDFLNLYATLLICLTLVLIGAGKVMGGVARLTVFTVPSISLLLISFLRLLDQGERRWKPGQIISVVLFIALFGNILSTCINNFTYPEYKQRVLTLQQTAKALREARLAKIPFLYTDALHGDGSDYVPKSPGTIRNTTITPQELAGEGGVSAEVIMKINPEYKLWDTIPSYCVPDIKFTSEYLQQVPAEYSSAIFCDGVSFKKVSR